MVALPLRIAVAQVTPMGTEHPGGERSAPSITTGSNRTTTIQALELQEGQGAATGTIR